jgi:hypothetical protein
LLGSRILADESSDGHWLQWASDTLIQDLEPYSDPWQGVGSWLIGEEVNTANELGEGLWALVKADPFSAAETLATHGVGLQPIASRLVLKMVMNWRCVG